MKIIRVSYKYNKAIQLARDILLSKTDALIYCAREVTRIDFSSSFFTFFFFFLCFTLSSTIALHSREGRDLIARESEWKDSVRKSAYFHCSFSLVADFLSRRSRGKRTHTSTDYLVPRGSRNFTTTTTTTTQSNLKTPLTSALMHIDKCLFFSFSFRSITEGKRNSLVRSRAIHVTPTIFHPHAILLLAATVAGLQHVILWQSN